MNQEEQWLLREKYHGEESEAFLAGCKRLAAGEPLAYVIGSIPFLDCMIWLDSHPLIPRPETEFWTKQLIDQIVIEQAPNKTIKVLDLCAGSGASGIAIARALPNTLVDFAEIEPLHLPTILHNLTHNNIDPARCTIKQSNLFTHVTDKYDYILSNPPYIDPTLNRTEASVTLHEPHLALYGGKAGLELISKIISEAPEYLTDAGQLWLEHEPEQSATVTELATKNGFVGTTYEDQYHIERYSVLVLQ